MAKKKKIPSVQDEIIDVCLRRGIIFPSAEIYGGMAGFYDFGPVGQSIRQNIIGLWEETFIRSEENVYQISGSTILSEKVFQASGHVDSFNDPMTQCDNCKSVFRVDHLILDKNETNVEGYSIDKMFKIIQSSKITCPNCSGNLSKPKEFNMMFKTHVGAVNGNAGYLRPETAQNIFLNFRRISHSMRAKLPFGIAQIGRAYRNEISPRNFLIRLREFEQMEIEMFVNPDDLNNHPEWNDFKETEINFLSQDAQNDNKKADIITIEDGVNKGWILNQYLGYYLMLETEFVKNLGLDQSQFWFRHLQESEIAHYSSANYDLEIQFPFGIVECIGLAYRTDYDLKKHQEMSKTKMHIEHNGQKVIPHVVEPSFGLNRLIYVVLLNSYQKEDRVWTWFKFPGALAPWEVLVAPLMKKDGLAEAAKTVFWDLKDQGLDVTYDKSGAIGKRYARSDEIGIPIVVTYDYDSKEDDTVTLRDRDTTRQVRVPLDDVATVIREYVLNLLSWDDIENQYKVV